MRKPSVFVVDDDPAVRKAVVLLIESAGLNVESYPSAEEFLDDCRPEAAGCLVLDVRMPGLGGLDLQQELAARGLRVPIVFITGFGDVPTSVRAVKAGAVDFLEKPFDVERLLQAVRQALKLDARLRQQRGKQKAFRDRSALLTPRETQVMGLLIAGKHAKQIAAELGISVKTVDKHRAKVLQKMQVDSAVELLRFRFAADVADPRPGTP